ncbi:MFS general substrate transporter [Pyrenophora seminiperda CCB06]|uniref:MFS general substrate transporter n=1 Tax=Pyrenophora seminiperda CCB06 TaxID=1302712 RepID=A0A3M7MJC5_9PLEO|nr:MFS general substrate transporter [Pyrenophora seminiperda CCB06]
MPRSREINGRQVVLRNGKLWIDTGTPDGSPLGHPYAGYYLPYPDTNYEGLVTTITDIAPIMNWVYIDKTTCEVKYGIRADAQPNLTGPFDCTRQDRRLTFDGWEGWCAVEEAPGLWGLYFDLFDDGLKSLVQPGTRVLEVELGRKEKRFQKEADARLHDQTTKREVDAKVEAPVERPLGAEALVGKPGVVVGGEGADVASDDRGTLRPLKIPKSIFEDPPPIVGGLVFASRTPKTPPPAYERVGREVSAQAVQKMKTDEAVGSFVEAGPSDTSAGVSNGGEKTVSTFVDEQMPRVANDLGSVQSQSVPIYEIPISPENPDLPPTEPDGRANYEMPDSPDKPDSPLELPTVDNTFISSPAGSPKSSTSERCIPTVTETLPFPGKPASPPAAPQITPKSEKRTTPKLNRNSGTRALAQAQMFEAMAAGQIPREQVQKRPTQRGSRASSNTSSLYSIEDEALNAPVPSKSPDLSPAPLSLKSPPQDKVLAVPHPYRGDQMRLKGRLHFQKLQFKEQYLNDRQQRL